MYRILLAIIVLFLSINNIVAQDKWVLRIYEVPTFQLEAQLPLIPVPILKDRTYDERVNHYCLGAELYLSEQMPGVIVCKDGDHITLLSRFETEKSGGKKKFEITRVYDQITFSREKLNAPKKLQGVQHHWFHSNSTCRTGFYDHDKCIDNGRLVSDLAIQMKPCYFVHGVGEAGPNQIIPRFPAYWGDLNSKMPQCTTFNFLWMDTKTRSWTSEELLKQVCSLITKGSMSIKNSYVYTHSMGGLIMTNAFMKGWCNIDKYTSRIYMSQPPLTGSLTARYVNSVCKGEHGDLMQTVAKSMNYCLPGDQGAWPAYYPMDPSNPELRSVIQAAGYFGDGQLCGDCSAVSLCGIGTLQESAGLKAIAAVSGLDYPNDGMVAYNSCASPTAKKPFEYDSTKAYYKGSMNHADGTCRNGDSIIQGLYPCEWFAGRYINS